MARRSQCWAVGPYCHRTFGQTPVLASLSQIQPTAICALQEVTASFSPPAHEHTTFKLIYTEEKKKYYWRNRKQATVSQRGKIHLPVYQWDDESKNHRDVFCGLLVFSVTLTGFKEIDDIHQTSREGFSCIQISYAGSTTAYSVAFLKVKISSVNLIKFTGTAALKRGLHKCLFYDEEVTRRVYTRPVCCNVGWCKNWRHVELL